MNVLQTITAVYPETSITPTYYVGHSYAICPGRGKSQVARYKLLNIRREDVRNISNADVLAEGFECVIDFWVVWTSFYETAEVAKQIANYASRTGAEQGEIIRLAKRLLADRPAYLYDAWALTFELVKP